MGITLSSKNFSADMGYGGFKLFREKVAALSSDKFGKHYELLGEGSFLFGEDKVLFFKKYDAETKELIKDNEITPEIANFCYQSDCEGVIDQNHAKQIYEKIKECDDSIAYGYVGRSDCATFSDLKNIFRDCTENGGEIEWF